MITTTLGQLANAQEAFDRLIALKLSVKAAYHLKKLLVLVRAELQHFQELRTYLIKELGAEREPTEAEKSRARSAEPVWEVLPENMLAFHAKVIELGNTEATITWGPFDLAWLGTNEVTAADLDVLGPLVCWTQEDGAGSKPGGEGGKV
jgi:hypothetical protein